MNDLLGMHVLEALANLLEVDRHLGLRSLLLLFNLHQRSIWHNLKNKINVALIMKETIKRGEVPML